MRHLRRLDEVVGWRLCIGCGACAYICPDNRVQLIDFFYEGIRPLVDSRNCGDCRLCLDVCPAVHSDFRNDEVLLLGKSNIKFFKDWGSVAAIWEGHAMDPEIRFKGASGGVLTAIATFCLEKLGMHGILHIAQNPEDAIRNRTTLSFSRQDLIATSGSRYSPASVCNGLGLVEKATSPCVVIGRPAEIAAVRNARKLRPDLDAKVGVTLSFFCAESPSTAGTVALLEYLGIDQNSLSKIRYRGYGWPGHFSVTTGRNSDPCRRMKYSESWAFLQAFRPWSVQLWPDSSGELADISCGDPWYDKPNGINPGFSLVVTRTELGQSIIEGAIAAGYLALKPAQKWKLVKSQGGLLSKKGSVWGRRQALRIFGLPVTSLSSLDLLHCWKNLSLEDKLRSTLGTMRRIIIRKLYRQIKLNSFESKPVSSPQIGT